MSALDDVLAKVPLELVPAIIRIVEAIVGAKDSDAAARAAEEAAQGIAMDELLKREKPVR